MEKCFLALKVPKGIFIIFLIFFYIETPPPAIWSVTLSLSCKVELLEEGSFFSFPPFSSS